MPRARRVDTAKNETKSSNSAGSPAKPIEATIETSSKQRQKRTASTITSDEPTPKRRKANRATHHIERNGNVTPEADEPAVHDNEIKTTQRRSKHKSSTLKDSKAPGTTNAGATNSEPLPHTKHRKETQKVKVEPESEEPVTSPAKATSKKPAKGGKKASTEDVKADTNDAKDTTAAESSTKPKRKRKTKEEKEAEAMPLVERTANTILRIGAHVSAAGGVQNAVDNCVYIGGNAFALFLKSQRKWENPALKPEHATMFKAGCDTHSYSQGEHVLPHGSYLVNLCSADPAKGSQAYNSFIDDLHRCETLGIKLYNFHPGNTNGFPRADAIQRLADRLNTAHKATSSVITVLENMAASPDGNTIGGAFEDLRDVIALVKDKSRVGVCLDTCHAFAGGYDLRTPTSFKATMSNFEEVIGINYLKAVHMNDSKAPFNSHRDLHQQIGLGFLGLRAFHNLVNDQRFHGLPLVLETPTDHKDENGKVVEDKRVWAREIKLLESLLGIDADGEEFRKLEKELAEKGEAERNKHQEQYNRKQEKATKRKNTKRSKKRAAGSSPENSSSDEG